ncbi:hypothetical protein [Sphingobacterium siyangense]|uniref:Uncharacterized protein n=1 Tax=Sphingobacterium siyangense TaxID=459529 RepID=A0A562MQH1_9SPHI|nr:hypothetical protein [Sphingobacterium siyangense]TWI22173.1 hypothetical protein IQ31_01578 [Sphingobacterium siyangense]
MQLYFTEDEMAEFLLARGYVIMMAVEELEVNTYQNVFLQEQKEVIKAFKGNYSDDLQEAFKRELKTKILTQ